MPDVDARTDDIDDARRPEPAAPAAVTVLTPRELLSILRRRWAVVLAIFALVVAVGAWRTWRQPHIYQASATVRFQQAQPPMSGMGAATPARIYGIDPLQSEQMLIRSKSVAELAAAQIGFRLQLLAPNRMRGAIFGDSLPMIDANARNGEYRLTFAPDGYELRQAGAVLGRARYGDRLNAAGISLVVPERPALREDLASFLIIPLSNAADQLRAGLFTRVIPQTDVVEITYQGPDPVVVRDAANSVAAAYAEFSSDLQTTQARTKTRFIERSLAERRLELESAQQRLQGFKERNQTPDVPSEMTALAENIQHLESERRSAIVEQNTYQQLLGKLSQADTVDQDLRRLAGTDAITKNSYVASLYTRWFDLLKSREEMMATGRGPSHPDVQAQDKLIARTKGDLQEASRLYLDGIASRLKSFDQTIAELRHQSERFPPLESEQARLTADVRTIQTTYDNLQREYQMAKIAESADGATVRLVDKAQLPTFAISPNRRRAVQFAMILGLLLGIAAAVGLEKIDDSVKSSDELPNRFQLPVLGQIPAIRAAGREEGTPLSRLVTHVDPRSVVAEAYRSLRTNIAFSRAQARIRTLVLTSPGPADGKSTTVANLAITFAQQGQKTLLVDADLRRAVLDKTFGVPRTPGLTEVVVGVAALDDAVHPTSVENLFVMGSGQLPPNPSELLGSVGMRDVLDAARERFDVILFDSPPLLAVTDAAVLSTMVEGSILVVRMGSTSREAVRRAAAHLRAVNSRVLGAVLNDIDLNAGSYYGGYGYYAYAYHPESGQRNGRGHRVRDRVRSLLGQGSGDSGEGS
ncbi:MAG TPA: polysaccharide biosynthesis tyrosine autokinase [Gemmatimonadaceae bacterium]|nr:polysaccharide biosynthesis tyrosine autokinase [Gemmatimonadaceae bacterium]